MSVVATGAARSRARTRRRTRHRPATRRRARGERRGARRRTTSRARRRWVWLRRRRARQQQTARETLGVRRREMIRQRISRTYHRLPYAPRRLGSRETKLQDAREGTTCLRNVLLARARRDRPLSQRALRFVVSTSASSFTRSTRRTFWKSRRWRIRNPSPSPPRRFSSSRARSVSPRTRPSTSPTS